MPFHSEVAEDRLTGRIIGIAINVHKTLGSQHPEKLYQEALAHGLERDGLTVEREKEITVVYQGREFGSRYADLFVENEVVVEIKAVQRVIDEHFHQLGTNVQLLEKRRGLLINFGTSRIEVRRFANDRAESTTSGADR